MENHIKPYLSCRMSETIQCDTPHVLSYVVEIVCACINVACSSMYDIIKRSFPFMSEIVFAVECYSMAKVVKKKQSRE